MKITLNFEVSSLPKKDGTYPIYLRATERGRHYKKALEVHVSSRNHFDAQAKKGNWISTKEPLAKVFNARLTSSLSVAHTLMSELERREDLSAYNLIKMLKGNNTDSFIEFIDRKIKQYLDKRQFSSAISFKNFKVHLLGYTKGNDVLFRDLTYSFVNGFITYINKSKKSTGGNLSQTTIYSFVCRFKNLYRQAVLEDLIGSQRNPFDRIRIKPNSPHRVSLSKEEVERLKDLKLEIGSVLWHTRNYFLFSMYMAGIRIGDIIRLRWDNIREGRLIYTMKKTSSIRSLPIIEQAKEILELYKTENQKSNDYIFPILDKRSILSKPNEELDLYMKVRGKISNINRSLKKLAELAKIDKNLSCHIARHTFASIAVELTGNIYMICQLLGHSNISTTQTYISSLSDKQRDEFLIRVFKE